jgi:DNA topoisomerase-1
VQQGENGEDKKVKPRRTSLPRGMDGDQITLEQALGLLSLPRLIGPHPETHENIEAGIGRFGPYVRMGAVYGSLDRDDDVLAIGINRAVDLIARKLASVRTLGAHPKDKELVSVRKGRFGPYVQHGTTVANLPRGVMMEDITLEEAVALLSEKGKQLKPRGAGGRRGRSARSAKPAAPAGEAAAKAKAKPAKRRATKAKRSAPKSAAKQPAAAKSPVRKKPAVGRKKAASGSSARGRAAE